MKKILFFVLCLYSFVVKAQNSAAITNGVINSWNANAANDWSANATSVFLTAITKQVGIGTNTPNHPLQVHQSVSGQNAVIQLTNATTGTGSADGGRLVSTISGTFDIHNLETGAITFTQNGAERMRVESAGNVGIANIAPNSTLSIGNNTSGANYSIEVAGANVTAAGNLNATQLNSAGLFFHSSAVAGFGQVATITAGGKTTGNFASKIAFQTTTLGGNQPTETVSISSLNNTTTLNVNGSFGANIRTFVANTTVLATDNTLVFTGGVAGISITLPTAALGKNRIYTIINKSTFPIASPSYLNLSNAATGQIPPFKWITIHSDGTSWHQIAGN